MAADGVTGHRCKELCIVWQIDLDAGPGVDRNGVVGNSVIDTGDGSPEVDNERTERIGVICGRLKRDSITGVSSDGVSVDDTLKKIPVVKRRIEGVEQNAVALMVFDSVVNDREIQIAVYDVECQPAAVYVAGNDVIFNDQSV